MSSSQIGSPPSHGETAGGNTLDAPRGTQAVHQPARPVLRIGTRLFNPLILRLAGSRLLPLFGVIHHQGRRSGRSYATPVAARRTAAGFVVPMTFGERADWFQNVLAAGGCVIRWKGVDYPVVEPEIIDWATARPAFSPVLRVLAPLFGIEQFVRLRHAPTSGSDHT
jgi:deazaflavin-dependent oxidoreductase (nitroreductase family)